VTARARSSAIRSDGETPQVFVRRLGAPSAAAGIYGALRASPRMVAATHAASAGVRRAARYSAGSASRAPGGARLVVAPAPGFEGGRQLRRALPVLQPHALFLHRPDHALDDGVARRSPHRRQRVLQTPARHEVRAVLSRVLRPVIGPQLEPLGHGDRRPEGCDQEVVHRAQDRGRTLGPWSRRARRRSGTRNRSSARPPPSRPAASTPWSGPSPSARRPARSRARLSAARSPPAPAPRRLLDRQGDDRRFDGSCSAASPPCSYRSLNREKRSRL